MPAGSHHVAEAVRLGRPGPHHHAGDVGGDLLEGALHLQLAERDDDGIVDGLGHLGQEVRGHQDGAALSGEIAHEVAQPGDALRVQAVRGLVEDEDVGVADERGGELEALAHTHRERADLALGVAAQADEIEDLVGTPVVVSTGACRHAQVGPGPARRVEARRLQHGADHRGRILEFLVATAVDGGGAHGGVHEAEQDAQRRRLAGAVRPENPVTRPGCTVKERSSTALTVPKLFEAAKLDREAAARPGAPAPTVIGATLAGPRPALVGLGPTAAGGPGPGQADVRRSTSSSGRSRRTDTASSS